MMPLLVSIKRNSCYFQKGGSRGNVSILFTRFSSDMVVELDKGIDQK